MPRRPKRRGINIHRNYTIDEISRATDTAEGTIRRWIKTGALPALTDKRPTLILGRDLVAFLEAKAKPKQKCAVAQCYCFSCRAPRAIWENIADFWPVSAKIGNLHGLCSTCSTVMNKRVSLAQLPALQAVLDVTIKQAPPRLIRCDEPRLNDHFGQG